MKSHVLVLLVTACVGVALASELPPVVGSFSPWSGHIGTPVTISGANFSPNPEENIVYFGGVRAVVTAATTNSLVVTAPAEATYQPITVTRSGLTGASRTAFVITFAGSDEPMLEQDGVSATIGSGFLLMGDLDGDGKLDRAVTAQFRLFGFTKAGGFHLFQNVGSAVNGIGFINTGDLQPDYLTDIELTPRDGAIVDLDGDGALDLVLIEGPLDRAVVFRNLGSNEPLAAATFAPPVSFGLPSSSFQLTAGDLDGDGHAEIITANGPGGITILPNLAPPDPFGSNSFGSPIVLANVLGFRPVVVDLDGDGKLDLVCLGLGGVILVRNVGSGPGLSPASFAAEPRVGAAANARGG